MANRIEGTVSQISPSGGLITDISNKSLAHIPSDESTCVKFGDFETFGIFTQDHQQPDATMVAFIGQDGLLQIEIVGISLTEMLGVGIGEKVVIKWSA